MPFEAPAPSVAMVCAETRVTFSIWNMFGKFDAVALPLLVTVAEKVVALPTTAVEAVEAEAMRLGAGTLVTLVTEFEDAIGFVHRNSCAGKSVSAAPGIGIGARAESARRSCRPGEGGGGGAGRLIHGAGDGENGNDGKRRPRGAAVVSCIGFRNGTAPCSIEVGACADSIRTDRKRIRGGDAV